MEDADLMPEGADDDGAQQLGGDNNEPLMEEQMLNDLMGEQMGKAEVKKREEEDDNYMSMDALYAAQEEVKPKTKSPTKMVERSSPKRVVVEKKQPQQPATSGSSLPPEFAALLEKHLAEEDQDNIGLERKNPAKKTEPVSEF
jgi:hypothetical protein